MSSSVYLGLHEILSLKKCQEVKRASFAFVLANGKPNRGEGLIGFIVLTLTSLGLSPWYFESIRRFISWAHRILLKKGRK